MMLWLFLALPALSAAAVSRAPRSCPPCEPSSCAELTDCAFRVLDACGCCELCAAGPGQACGGRGGRGAARCAPGFECVKPQGDAKPMKKKRNENGVCMCKDGNYEVCGSDGVEYRSACELRAASASAESQQKPAIKVRNKGKCAKAPVIVTGPGEIWNVTGVQVFLSCEAIGVPTPVLTWRKMTYEQKPSQLLPGDQDNLAIQMRGGPEKHEVTGWVLIFPLTKEAAGTYECHVSNALGEASATGTIHVVDSIDDIPSKKVVQDDEL